MSLALGDGAEPRAIRDRDQNARIVPSDTVIGLILTAKEAARLLKLSVRTLERMRAKGTGPAFHKTGRSRRARVLYCAAAIHTWLAERTFTATSQYFQR